MADRDLVWRRTDRVVLVRVYAVILVLEGVGLGAFGCKGAEERFTTDATSTSVRAADAVREEVDPAPADAGNDAVRPVDALALESRAEHVPDPANQSRPPFTSDDLQERAGHLLLAIARNDPAAADDFFFPKEPFVPLKDVGDPGRYFDQLLATYHRDIRSLHAERKDWAGVSFVSFELGTTPTWVMPGKEYNKIGYFRTFGGKLRYRLGERVKELRVGTIISWDGRWYVTHLSPIKH
jgi:hypothetical protein